MRPPRGPGSAIRKAAAAEQRIAWVRLSVVAFNSVVYALWMRGAGWPELAWTVIVAANLYSLGVTLGRPERRFPAMATAMWTTVTDALLIVLWLSATGGAASPFWILWSFSLVAIAFRFGSKETWAAGAVYVFLEASLLARQGLFAWPMDPLAAVRVGYIALFGGLAGGMADFTRDALDRERRLDDLSKRLRSSQGDLEAVLAYAPSIVMRVDREGRILYINRVVPGLDESDVVGRSMTEFVPPETAERLRGYLKRVVEKGEAVTYEVEGLGPDGAQAIYESRMAPVRHGDEAEGAVLLTLDVTRERRQAQEVAEARLVEERREAELRRLRDEDAFRRDLLNAVAHELNTPLTPLKLQLHLLRRDPQRLQDALEVLERNMDRLAFLVGDLLEVSRLQEQRGALHLESVDLGDLVAEAVATFHDPAGDQGVALTHLLKRPLPLQADRMRITQVLYNLLSNALKFSPSGSTIRIEAAVEGDRVRCAVVDEGPGLSKEDARRVFEPFVQAHTGKGGSGLGLHITKGIVEAHGGAIGVDSAGAGQGCSFWFELPAGGPAKKLSPPREAS
ncbi:MAG: ATP-binding protein [Thermoplasmatota archaeon]